jgi:hypothetical protein
MFFSAARNPCPGRNPTFRPMLEVLEDRVTPSGAAVTNLDAVGPLSAAQAVTPLAPAAQGLTFTFSPPDRLIISNNQTSAKLAVTLTNTADGTPVSDGAVTFTITNSSGTVLGQSVTANLSSDGKATAAYGLPANLPIGPYTITAVYHKDGSANDGASGSELLSIVLPAIPAVHGSQGSGQASAQSVTQAAPSVLDAALTLYLDGIQRALNQLTGQFSGAVQASIDANLPFAGPWGSLFEMAGETAVFQAVHASNS